MVQIIIESKDFFDLPWSTAETYLEKMPPNRMKVLIAFAHGYIEQHKKGRC